MSKFVSANNEYRQTDIRECVLCQSSKGFRLFYKYDDRFGQPDIFTYVYCPRCNLLFLKNKIIKSSLPILYRKYYPKSKKRNLMSSKLKFILEMLRLDKLILQSLAGNPLLLSKVEKKSRVLEIGSGYSPDIKKIVKANKIDWTGLEVDKNYSTKIKADNLKIANGTIETFRDVENQGFDYIILSQSIEHQYDIDIFFEKSRRLLKKGGKILFTTPNIDSKFRKKYGSEWINWHAPYHIVLLSRKAIGILCKRHNFHITKYFTFTPTSWYFLQKAFVIPPRGQRNNRYNFNFSLISQLMFSSWLRLSEIFDKKRGDCIYCEVTLNN